MKILIDTSKKTIKLEGKVRFGKLMEFVKKNDLQDYEIEPEVITVKENELYPWHPAYPVYPIFPNIEPYYGTYKVACDAAPEIFYTNIN